MTGRLVPQIQRRDAVGVGQPPVGTGVEIQAGDEVEQPAVGSVREFYRQGFLIERIDIAADDGIEQPAQSALLRVVPADIVEFLLKSAESPQAVVLLRKPRMQVVHIHKSLFKQEKKLPVYMPAEGSGQMLISQTSAAFMQGVFDVCTRGAFSYLSRLRGRSTREARRVGECFNERRR
jgi:hypothetical protein